MPAFCWPAAGHARPALLTVGKVYSSQWSICSPENTHAAADSTILAVKRFGSTRAKTFCYACPITPPAAPTMVP